MVIYLPLLVAIVGLVIYALTSMNAKASEIGRIMFWVGLLAFLLNVGPRVVGVMH